MFNVDAPRSRLWVIAVCYTLRACTLLCYVAVEVDVAVDEA